CPGEVAQRHGPEEAVGGVHVPGHGQGVGLVHVAGEGVEVAGAEHHRVGRGGGIEQQGGQALGFPDQGVVLLGVVDEQGVQGVGTVGLDHWVFSSNKVLGGVATGVGHSVAGQEAVFVEVVEDGLNLLL